jgi:hypothetical protein
LNRPTRREAVIAVLLLSAWWLGLAVHDGAILLTRRFHLDELCCTVYALREASNPLEVARLALRYDIAPPLLHSLLWPVAQLAGSEPTTLRVVPLMSVALATILLYFVLRRRFGIASSAAGVLAVLSNSLVITHAFELRFYGLWLLLGCAFAWAVGLDPGRPSRPRDVALALLAAGLCALHWFGVTSLALLVAGAFAARAAGAPVGPRFGEWRQALRLLAPAIAGPIVLLLLLPAMLRQLEYSGVALLWVPTLSVAQVMQMAQFFWIRIPIAVGFALLLAYALFPALAGPVRITARVGELLRDPSLGALVATLLMPVVLILITIVLEPVMVPRYAIVGVLAAAPVVALAIEPLGKVGRAAIFVVLALLLIGFADRELLNGRSTEAYYAAYERDLREAHRLDPALPLVFQSYPLAYATDGDARRQTITRVMQLSDSALDALYPPQDMNVEKIRLLRARRMVQLHEATFGFPRSVSVNELQAAPRFALFARDSDLPASLQSSIALGQRLFPSHSARRVSDIVTVFERSP